MSTHKKIKQGEGFQPFKNKQKKTIKQNENDFKLESSLAFTLAG